jgi:hypothetical protein
VPKTYIGERTASLINGASKIRYVIRFISPYIYKNTNSKWIKDLNEGPQTMKLLEENEVKHFKTIV